MNLHKMKTNDIKHFFAKISKLQVLQVLIVPICFHPKKRFNAASESWRKMKEDYSEKTWQKLCFPMKSKNTECSHLKHSNTLFETAHVADNDEQKIKCRWLYQNHLTVNHKEINYIQLRQHCKEKTMESN